MLALEDGWKTLVVEPTKAAGVPNVVTLRHC